jgi:predicted O-methyltransferase YrrM
MMDPAGAGCPRGADPASLRPLPGRREPAGSRRGGAPRGASIPERGGSGLHAGPGPRRRARPRVAHLVYLTLIGILLGLFLSYRSRLHHLQGRPRRGAIRLAQVEELDPIFAPDELGPTLEAEVLFLGSGSGVPAGTSDTEAWILSVLAKRAEVLFEFGTATGRTSYLWARNSPAHARVSTLTLPPEEHAAYRREWTDNRRAAQHALRESRFTRFRYQGTPEEAKITQLYGDSKEFDETPFHRRCDLIFVDGSHAYSYVRSDSEKALRMVAPGGIVLWHDYWGRTGTTADVYRYLNRLARELPLLHLHGTSLVAFRAPTDLAPPA